MSILSASFWQFSRWKSSSNFLYIIKLLQFLKMDWIYKSSQAIKFLTQLTPAWKLVYASMTQHNKQKFSFEVDKIELDRESFFTQDPFHLFLFSQVQSQQKFFSKFSCRFLNPNNFFQFELQLLNFHRSEKPSGTS